METVIGKAMELVLQYTVIPIARQFKYVCCYKSCVVEMYDANHKLQNEKEIVDREKSAAKNNGQLIYRKADDWLEDVTKTQEEVSSLMTYEEIIAKKSGCSIGGQILNPIARHELGKKATRRKQAIEDLRRERPRPKEISYPPSPPGIVTAATASASAAAIQRTDGVFRSSRWDEIVEEIMTALKDNNTNVIGLHGMGGVGKSTMINEVYDQVKKQGMFDEVAKVEVKAKPEIKRIQEEIAFQLGLKFKNEWSSAIRADRLRERFLSNKDDKNDTDQKKKKKTVLLILDDLWEVVDFREVGIPLAGSDQVQIKLFLTSRDEYLLSYKMGAHDPIHLDVLSDADALRMFKFFVGGGAENIDAEKVTATATKCRGLPIVIEVTAKALKNRALGEWEKILKRLDNADVLEKLKVSYDYLPRKESKDLFLLCGIIRGQRIRVRDLLKYTFGLGFYEGREDIQSLADAESELEELLYGLEAASMLLKRDDNLYVNIHDRMRDLAFRIVDSDRLEWVHFTLRDDSYKLPRKFEASKLELLLSYCEEEGGTIQVPDLFFKEMKKLYVLEFTNLRGALPSPTELHDHLRNLGTLCLHNCSLDDVSMIGELKGLQILSFRGSSICKLPIQLRGLIALKMLDLSNCAKLTEIEPDVLGSLTKVEELNMENSFKNWELDQEEDDAHPPSNARLIELRNMVRLSNVKIHIPSTSMLPKIDQLFSSELTIYKIMLGGVWNWDIIDSNRQESKVLMLQFDDSPNVLQLDWVQDTLQRTEVLYLNGLLDGKCESIDELCIKGFECLKHLQVRGCPSIRYIASSNSGSSFMDLEFLALGVLENLEKLCNGETFSKLKVTRIDGCNKLTHLFDFSVLNCNSELEEIIIEDCKEIHCIVIDEDDKNDDVVKLLKLQRLELQCLPKFQAFWVPQGPQLPMKVLFSGRKVAFPFLESLEIRKLDELEYIWHPTDPPTELGNLRSLDVGGCNKLVCVIHSNVLMRLEQHLESLSIDSCASIEHVFDVEDDTIGSGTSTAPHELSLFCKVKDIRIENMKRLKRISKNLMIGRDCVLTIFPNIRSLVVSCCRDLRYVLSSSLPTEVGAFQLLTEILIHRCDKMEAVIAVMVMGEETQQAAIEFSSLKRFRVGTCKKLKTFCWYENMVASTNITVSTSQQDHVALPLFSQKENFPCLETLYLSGLEELRQIWPHEVVVAQGSSFYNLKEVVIRVCPKLSEVFPSTLIECLQKLENISVEICELMQSIIVHEKNIKPTLAMMEAGQHQAIVEFTFPCLRELYLFDLLTLDRFYSSSSASVHLPSLKTLAISSCPKVKALFIQRPHATADLVGSDDDDDLNSNGVETAFFGYGDKQAKSIPNLKMLRLYGLESFTGIWKMKSDDESCSDSIVEPQQELEGNVEDGEFCIRSLENLGMSRLPKLKWNISISDKKCTIINNNNKLPPFNEYILFPSMQELTVNRCGKVKLFDSDSSTNRVQLDHVYTAIEQFLIKAIPSSFRSLEISCKNGTVELKMAEEHDMRFGQKQHLHLSLRWCKTSSSCRNLLPLTSHSFCNVITQLNVLCSEGLKYLLTPQGATSLVHLTHLTIGWCKNIKEIVVAEEEETVDNENGGGGEEEGRRGDIREIVTFNHLKELALWELKNLESFSSSSTVDLNFPSLEKLNIEGCRKMRIFSNGGILTTPKLHQVIWDRGYHHQLTEDLNTTVQKKYAGEKPKLKISFRVTRFRLKRTYKVLNKKRGRKKNDNTVTTQEPNIM